MNLLLYGAPGRGKGTQANMLRSRFGILDAAHDWRDDLTIGVARNRLSQPDCAPGFIMDGFPRTVPQAEALDVLMSELGKRFDQVIYLKVPVEELLSRLSGRLVCPKCQRTYPPGTVACVADGSELVQREDDRPEAVRPRIEIYLDKTVPVLDHYRVGRLVSEIDGRGTIDEISRQVLAAANGHLTQRSKTG